MDLKDGKDGKGGPSTSSGAATSASRTSASASGAEATPKKALKPQNPVFKMMGLPRFRLPSRNWLIFWGIIASWSATVYHDRREKKRILRQYCAAVSHLSLEPLPASQQQRKLTVFLSAAPADGLLAAREHFHEYVRPILQSAGLDWDAIEGRREGDVRAGLAEWIRKRRKMGGEGGGEGLDEGDEEVVVERLRRKMGVREWEGVAGDLVVGRNTWKEYVRGLHEGWLGPLEEPEKVGAEGKEEDRGEAGREEGGDGKVEDSGEEADQTLTVGKVVFDSETEKAPDPDKQGQPVQEDDKKEGETEEEKKADKAKKRKQPPPFIEPSQYASASVATSIPTELGPSAVIPYPTIFGFRNTPIRIYRYLTQRKLADEIGKEVVAVCFAAYRPYERGSESGFSTVDEASDSPSTESEQDGAATARQTWEQEAILKKEEAEWHKSVRKERDPEKESVWLDDMALDPRIAGRMRKFYLREGDVEEGVKAGEEAKRRNSGDADVE